MRSAARYLRYAGPRCLLAARAPTWDRNLNITFRTYWRSRPDAQAAASEPFAGIGYDFCKSMQSNPASKMHRKEEFCRTHTCASSETVNRNSTALFGQRAFAAIRNAPLACRRVLHRNPICIKLWISTFALRVIRSFGPRRAN